jgi:hypothetical protein
MTSTASPQALTQLAQLRAQVDALAAQQLPAAALGTQARASRDLLAALPDRFETVLLDLLDRLEAGALFTEESCSFSQHDLIEHLRTWIDKAQARLEQAPAAEMGL